MLYIVCPEDLFTFTPHRLGDLLCCWKMVYKLVVSSPNPSSDSRTFLFKRIIINHNLIWETPRLKLALNDGYPSLRLSSLHKRSISTPASTECYFSAEQHWRFFYFCLSIERQKTHYYHPYSSFHRKVTKYSSLNIDLMHQITYEVLTDSFLFKNYCL